MCSVTINSFFFSQCMALQCYIHPLSSILNGLRSGRYRERKSAVAFFSSCSPHMPFHIGSGVGLRCRHFWIETRSPKQLSTLLLSRFPLTLALSFLLSFFLFGLSFLLSLSLSYYPPLFLFLFLSPKQKQKTGMWCTILGGIA